MAFSIVVIKHMPAVQLICIAPGFTPFGLFMQSEVDLILHKSIRKPYFQEQWVKGEQFSFWTQKLGFRRAQGHIYRMFGMYYLSNI